MRFIDMLLLGVVFLLQVGFAGGTYRNAVNGTLHIETPFDDLWMMVAELLSNTGLY